MPPHPTIASLTISTSNSLPLGLRSYSKLAAETTASGIEVDLTTRTGRRLYPPRSLFVEHHSTTIRGLRLSGIDPMTWEFLPSHDPRNIHSPLTIIVQLPAATFERDLAIVRTARECWLERAWIDHVTIALPASAAEGGRAHLTRVQMLRRYLEEWDLELGLDLGTLTDSRWEAEAAILLAGERLTHIRLAAPLYRSVDPRSAVLRRTFAALAESNFNGTLSIAPTTPLWLAWHHPSVVRDIEANLAAVSQFFDARSFSHREPFELRHSLSDRQ